MNGEGRVKCYLHLEDLEVNNKLSNCDLSSSIVKSVTEQTIYNILFVTTMENKLLTDQYIPIFDQSYR